MNATNETNETNETNAMNAMNAMNATTDTLHATMSAKNITDNALIRTTNITDATT
nr:MAG: hypothetical protein AmFV_00281 [Apis mellifera filamentous virus]